MQGTHALAEETTALTTQGPRETLLPQKSICEKRRARPGSESSQLTRQLQGHPRNPPCAGGLMGAWAPSRAGASVQEATPSSRVFPAQKLERDGIEALSFAFTELSLSPPRTPPAKVGPVSRPSLGPHSLAPVIAPSAISPLPHCPLFPSFPTTHSLGPSTHTSSWCRTQNTAALSSMAVSEF